MKIKGLDKIQNDIKKLQKNAKKMNGEYSVPFDELFPYEFMNKNTNLDSIDDFFKSANLEINTQEDFEELDERILDEAVVRLTQFNSWEEMLSKAGELYLENELFKGVKF